MSRKLKFTLETHCDVFQHFQIEKKQLMLVSEQMKINPNSIKNLADRVESWLADGEVLKGWIEFTGFSFEDVAEEMVADGVEVVKHTQGENVLDHTPLFELFCSDMESFEKALAKIGVNLPEQESAIEPEPEPEPEDQVESRKDLYLEGVSDGKVLMQLIMNIDLLKKRLEEAESNLLQHKAMMDKKYPY